MAVLDGLDGVIAPLQTLCDSPRESKDNDRGLKEVLDTRRYIEGVLSPPQLTDEEAEHVEHEPSSPVVKM